MQMKGAQILIETLISEGVDIVFGYPGGTVVDIYDALYQSSDRITHILSAHEQGAAHAADGYARTSGKTGVVFATSGPGATNLVTGIANAYLDSVPLVAVTGNVAAHLLGRDTFQEVDIIGVTLPIVKHSFLIKDVNALESTIREAFRIAGSGRKGPVLIDIPKNIQAATGEYSGIRKEFKPVRRQLPAGEIDGALAAIADCKKPYIYCGGGVTAAHAEKEIMELSKRLDAPIGLSMMGLTAVPNSYPLNLGMSGMHGKYASTLAQSEADLIIAAGVRFSDRATGNTGEYAKNAAIIHIDIDAAELGKNVRPRIGLCGDVKDILGALLDKLPPHKNDEWLARIAELKQRGSRKLPDGFTPQNIILGVHEVFGDDAMIATDVGQHQMWVMQTYPFEKPNTLLSSGGLGTMGYGLGAAIGGCVARGGKRTVLFTSDGCFGMNLIELATAVSQKLPLVIVLMNNNALGMVKQWQHIFYEKRYSQTVLNRKTDFPMLARAFGAAGYSAFTMDEFMGILRGGLPDDRPAVIDCRIDTGELVLPMIPGGGTVNDIITD